MKNDIDENKQKGDAFEKWVVKKFDRYYFHVEEWRSDKYVDGIYPASNHFPDLEICFSLPDKNINKTFALECKWRQGFFKGGIEWAKDYQIKNYKEYAKKIQLPVFVIIGIDGFPDEPKHLYIIPLSSINDGFLSCQQLEVYRQSYINKSFFFDYKNEILFMEKPKVFDWAIYIDIEGFSSIYNRDSNKAKRGILLLSDLLFELIEKHYEQPLTITQFGSDGFLILQRYVKWESLDFPIDISVFLMQKMLLKGYTTKSIISYGTLEDVSNDYSEQIKNYINVGRSINLNNSILQLTPFIGSSIINTYKLEHASGPLLVIDSTIGIYECLGNYSFYFYKIEEKQNIYFNWIKCSSKFFSDKVLIKIQDELKLKMKNYIIDNKLKGEWKKNAENLIK